MITPDNTSIGPVVMDTRAVRSLLLKLGSEIASGHATAGKTTPVAKAVHPAILKRRAFLCNDIDWEFSTCVDS